jgi:hypothetical protein
MLVTRESPEVLLGAIVDSVFEERERRASAICTIGNWAREGAIRVPVVMISDWSQIAKDSSNILRKGTIKNRLTP